MTLQGGETFGIDVDQFDSRRAYPIGQTASPVSSLNNVPFAVYPLIYFQRGSNKTFGIISDFYGRALFRLFKLSVFRRIPVAPKQTVNRLER